MQLTPEQQAIVNSSGNIKINAVAGSGKTTTLVAYAQARPQMRMLYLAFNKSVKTEAVKKFAEKGLQHVTVETAHSLAFRYVVKSSGYTVKKDGGYKTTELAELLELNGDGHPHTRFILASHINKLIACFCNSAKNKVQEVDYENTLADAAARQFVINFKAVIEKQARIFLDKMNKGEVDIVHDFYLKKFQQLCPVLPYDCILFDEGQDASEAMLDVFLRQPCAKVIAGDTHQQIYGWRYAVNSLEKVDFPVFNLTVSFRFNSEIASLATRILEWKEHFSKPAPVTITGMGQSTAFTKAFIARTNSSLLVKAIEMHIETRQVDKLYFEGRFESCLFADEGASLYDVLNLYLGKKHLVKDKLLASLTGMAALEEYVEKTEDRQLGLLAGVVKQYGERLPELIKKLKTAQVEGDEKGRAGMIFSTVHKCKGMEYGTVTLAEDFITEEKIKSGLKELKVNPQWASRINEEINILYVAVTRTMGELFIPQSLMPQSAIHVISRQTAVAVLDDFDEDDLDLELEYHMNSYQRRYQPPPPETKPRTKRQPPLQPQKAGQPWRENDDLQLTELFCKGNTVEQIAVQMERTANAIESRIKKLELRDIYGIE